MRRRFGTIWEDIKTSLASMGVLGKALVVGALMYQFKDEGLAIAQRHFLSEKEMHKIVPEMGPAMKVIASLRAAFLEPLELTDEYWQRQIEALRKRVVEYALMNDDVDLAMQVLRGYDRKYRKGSQPQVSVTIQQRLPYRSPVTGQVIDLDTTPPELPEGVEEG